VATRSTVPTTAIRRDVRGKSRDRTPCRMKRALLIPATVRSSISSSV
jgi:hypothetical protein